MTAQRKRNNDKTRQQITAPLGNGKAGQSFAAPLLLGDVVYRCNHSSALYRIQDAGDESYDLSKWTGSSWEFHDNIGFESARMRLKKSWEVYVRAVT